MTVLSLRWESLYLERRVIFKQVLPPWILTNWPAVVSVSLVTVFTCTLIRPLIIFAIRMLRTHRSLFALVNLWKPWRQNHVSQYSDVMMGAMASQITSVSIVYSTVCSGSDQRKHQRSASLAFVRGIHRWPVNSFHKGPVTWKMFPFDDVIMILLIGHASMADR